MGNSSVSWRIGKPNRLEKYVSEKLTHKLNYLQHLPDIFIVSFNDLAGIIVFWAGVAKNSEY